jgi:signal transduction histidine kinase
MSVMSSNKMEVSRKIPIPVVLALAILLLAAYFVWLRLSTPFDGTRLEPDEAIWSAGGVRVSLLEDQRGRLQSGDIIVAIEGQSVATWAEHLLAPTASRPERHFGQTVIYAVERSGQRQQVDVTLGTYPWATVLSRHWGVALVLLLFQLVATFVLLRRPQERAAQLLFLAWSGIVAGGAAWIMGLQVGDLLRGDAFWLYRVVLRGAYMLGMIVSLHIVLVWPQPSRLVTRHRELLPLIYFVPYTLYAALLLTALPGSPSILAWIGVWQPFERLVDSILMGLALIVLLARFRGFPRDSLSRLQLRWIVFALGFGGSLAIGLAMIPELILGHSLIDWNLIALLWLPVPLSVAVAVLRYRLFDIDLIINRTLVYGVLTLIVGGLYIVVVGIVSGLFNMSDNLPAALLAAGVVAIAFQPLRERLQRAVNRLIYGERDEPYQVLSRLGQRLQATLAPDKVLPTIVETVAQALKLPYTAISLEQGGGSEIVASYGARPVDSALVRVPVTYQAQNIAELLLAPRSGTESFTASDMRLLQDIAHQAGVAAHSVRLTADLQRSRERLVTAREEERRRLRRDLHDGIGPALASLTLTVDAANNLLDQNPAAIRPLLADLKEQAQEAIVDIRRLVYGLRPPALDELGLISALREQAAQYSLNGLRISIDAPADLPPLPAAVEVAAYRISQEALTNVVRHAHARSCNVHFRLSGSGGLQVDIIDDGEGLSNGFRAGVGLSSMCERAEELGGTCTIESGTSGGTHVAACLPLSGRVERPMEAQGEGA